MSGSAFGPSPTSYAGKGIRTVDQSYGQAIAEGDIFGHDKWKVVGFRTAVPTTESHLALGATGRFPWPSVPITVYLNSSSASDDAGGTGARTVRFYGIVLGGAVDYEDIALDGTTKVATAKQYLAPIIDQTVVTTTGTGLSNAGTITCSTVAGATGVGDIWWAMTAGTNQAAGSVYYVPTGKTAFLIKILVGEASTQGATFRLYACAPGGLFLRRDVYQVDGQGFFDEFLIPPKYPAGTRLEVTSQSSSGTAIVSAKFLGWVE
jgi:hypothetical protein